MAAAPLEAPELDPAEVEKLIKKKGAIDYETLLEKRLWDGRVHVRRNAALVLALGGEIPEGKESLLPIAGKDTDAVVREHVAAAFGKHPVEASIAIPALLKSLLDASSSVSDAALRSLGVVMGRQEPAAYTAMVKALGDGRPFVQVTAVDLLVQQGADAVEQLLEGLRDTGGLVRKGARQCLRMLGSMAAGKLIAALEDDELRDPVKRILDDVPLTEGDEKALEKLVKGGAPVVQMVARRLIDGATSKRKKLVESELAAVPNVEIKGFYDGAMDGKAVKAAAKGTDPMLMVRALGDARPVARQNASAVLVETGLGDSQREVTIPKLAAAVKDDDAVVRANIVKVLASSGGEIAADQVARAATDPDVSVREAVMEGLAKIATAEPVHLLDSLGNNVAEPTREVTIAAFVGAGKAAVKTLGAALDDIREAIRVSAAKILGQIGSAAQAALGQLIEATQDPYEEVRIQAALAIGKVAKEGDDKALSAVRVLINDSSFPVRQAASWAEDRLLGRPEQPASLEARELPSAEFADVILEEAALKKLAKSFDPVSLGQLLFDGRAPCRANAARALGILGKAGAPYALQLCVALKDGEEGVKAAAAHALGMLQVEQDHVVPALVQALRGAGEETQAAIIAAVDGFGKKAVPPVVKLLSERPERVVAAIGTTARSLPKTFLKPLADALGDEELDLVSRENAADILAELGDEAAGAEAALVAALAEQSVLFRVKIIRALGKGGAIEATRKVLLELSDNDKRLSIQDAIDDALRMLRSRARAEGGVGGKKKGKKK